MAKKPRETPVITQGEAVASMNYVESKGFHHGPLQKRCVLVKLLHLSSSEMGGQGKVFTLADVAQHNTPKDCWLIIDAKVYDVTKFLDDHPGGDEVLLSATVFAINSLYAALGSPPLPGWVPIGGDPCMEAWQGVLCVNANITGMVDAYIGKSKEVDIQ